MKNVLTCLLFFTLFASSCEKDDPIIPNEEELITSLVLQLTDAVTQEVLIFSFVDIDGDGGFEPEITNASLRPNTSYDATVFLSNASFDPPLDVSAEVIEEAEAHQLFYQNTPGLNLEIKYNDSDINGHPIGLSLKIDTKASSKGVLTVTLRHEPLKDSPSVISGDINMAGGETDIEVHFDVEIK